MPWIDSKRRFLLRLRNEGKIDHGQPYCSECKETVHGEGVFIGAHPAVFDGEGNVEYSGDQTVECSILCKGCAKKSGWLRERTSHEWI